jgi:hypothetical protein
MLAAATLAVLLSAHQVQKPTMPKGHLKFMGLGRWGGEGKDNFVDSMAVGWANLAWGGLGGAAFDFAQIGIQYPLDSPTNAKKFANKTLYPDGWRSAAIAGAASMKSQVWPKGNLAVLFIGDEGCCYAGCNETNYIKPLTDAIREGIGGGKGAPPYIYANECGPWWADYAVPPCCGARGTFANGTFRDTSPCHGLAYQCQDKVARAKLGPKKALYGPCTWETIPDNLDMISFDFYFPSNGTFEAENIQRAYKDCLLPKLGPHQFAVVRSPLSPKSLRH